MSLNLPEHPSHEFLKTLARQRLAALRRATPATTLAAAQARANSATLGAREWLGPSAAA